MFTFHEELHNLQAIKVSSPMERGELLHSVPHRLDVDRTVHMVLHIC